MPTFIANERLRVHGLGRVEAGSQFTISDHHAKQLVRLESKGLIVRHHATPIHRAAAAAVDGLKALVGYENKAIAPSAIKQEPKAASKGGRR